MSRLLSLRTVSVTLKRRRVLDDVSLVVHRREIVSLLGPNGAGKTTLMRAALGLAPCTGSTLLGDTEVKALSVRQRALRAAYMPQRPSSVWPVRVEALVALGRFAHGAAPERLSARDRDAVDAAIVACGLSELRSRRMDEISGGEKVRVHLARALAQQAPLLLLDEPTAGLDPAQTLTVAEILQNHATAGGVLVSTHDIAFAASVSHRVVLMRDGRVIAEGPPEATLTPQAIETAYARTGRLERVGQNLVALFE